MKVIAVQKLQDENKKETERKTNEANENKEKVRTECFIFFVLINSQ